ncbi:MAG: hypothetical protein AABZ18_07125 [Pseudomonadota bacterium]
MKTLLRKYVPFLPVLALLYFFMQVGSADAYHTDNRKIEQNVITHSDDDNFAKEILNQ